MDKNIANLDARYKYLNACYEVEILSERMSEEEGRAIQKYLEDSRQFIHDIDGAGFLSQEKLDRVADIGSREYITPDGQISVESWKKMELSQQRKEVRWKVM